MFEYFNKKFGLLIHFLDVVVRIGFLSVLFQDGFGNSCTTVFQPIRPDFIVFFFIFLSGFASKELDVRP